MKRNLKILGIILAAVLIGIIILGVAEKNNFLGMKKWGTKEYYVQIKDNGEEYITKNTEGEKSVLYFYKTDAYNKDGKQIKVEFHSDKNLKLDAYLLVLAFSQDKNDYNQILSYEEVHADKVPSKAKEQLDK
ncbi:YxeA family protein [Oceanirhabdus seepicola]|uniref:YxeA family protein n=1 Tax=Oceanirhabdus seepicola TaxID=2828781 RepID=A0A9J6P675_9CLOT|nr:YxeA family protein [Oceanirhabdus seepicola]MCM1992231.1 YxeA family protein [Oceanirhabdus seepicola]